jgi:hypothetical protein
MNEKVSQLRRLIAEASPRRKELSPAQATAQREYEFFAANEPVQHTLDASPRARAVREILRIAAWYNGQEALAMALDRVRANSLADLPVDDLDALLETMRQIELCAQTGAGSPFAPPAT